MFAGFVGGGGGRYNEKQTRSGEQTGFQLVDDERTLVQETERTKGT
jgi:hypothetical protein